MTSARALMTMRKQGSHLSNTAASMQITLRARGRREHTSGQLVPIDNLHKLADLTTSCKERRFPVQLHY